ncbi:hypothetical protein Nepgr_023015 [Nepenthes gracilis]|uniref:Uncharacterized protein n=1 Tax=Nepenthes gracilis TaxID=150966 RepID=A0AAD3T1A8_NEPGR|nr:hypothetical protein Nepgr_023015 [Nepenthes gracilis]
MLQLSKSRQCQASQEAATTFQIKKENTAQLHLASNTAASTTIIKPANGILNAKNMIYCYISQTHNWAQQQDKMSQASIEYDPPSAQASHERPWQRKLESRKVEQPAIQPNGITPR